MKWLIAALMFPLVSAATMANQDPQPGTAGEIKVAPVTQLRPGVDAWPLILDPETPPEQRVNATLTNLNQRLQHALQDCDASYQESLKQMGDGAKNQDPVSKDWSRRIVVTMRGPRFLSLLASDSTSCGGAHPNSDQVAMVFDMNSGAPVNWTAVMASTAGAAAYKGTSMGGSAAGALVLPGLKTMAVAVADADCKDAFLDTQPFLIWPDAQHGKLVAQPFDLPHVVQACANQIDLTPDQARKLGFDESLVGAIEQAHRLAK